MGFALGRDVAQSGVGAVIIVVFYIAELVAAEILVMGFALWQCCSIYGWCGTTSAHCNNGANCGNGNAGNGICPDRTKCCSFGGHCGSHAGDCHFCLGEGEC
jgi:hypothetical protein